MVINLFKKTHTLTNALSRCPSTWNLVFEVSVSTFPHSDK